MTVEGDLVDIRADLQLLTLQTLANMTREVNKILDHVNCSYPIPLDEAQARAEELINEPVYSMWKSKMQEKAANLECFIRDRKARQRRSEDAKKAECDMNRCESFDSAELPSILFSSPI